jgi:hypothetical protein
MDLEIEIITRGKSSSEHESKGNPARGKKDRVSAVLRGNTVTAPNKKVRSIHHGEQRATLSKFNTLSGSLKKFHRLIKTSR